MNFKLTVEGNVIEQIHTRELAILVSTYQTGKILVFSSKGSELIKQEVLFKSSMVIAVPDNQLTFAVSNSIIYYANPPSLSRQYSDKLLSPDACFVPMAVFLIRKIRGQYITFYKQEVLALNSRFSCPSYVDLNNSLIPVWKPTFINYISNDYCHLSDMAIIDYESAYVTALGETNEKTVGKVLLAEPCRTIYGVKKLKKLISPRVLSLSGFLH